MAKQIRKADKSDVESSQDGMAEGLEDREPVVSTSSPALVTGANGKMRSPRQGDSAMVQCQLCTEKAGHPVYCKSYNTKTRKFDDRPMNRAYTYYKCPVCGMCPPKVVNYQVLKVRQKRTPQQNFDSRA